LDFIACWDTVLVEDELGSPLIESPARLFEAVVAASIFPSPCLFWWKAGDLLYLCKESKVSQHMSMGVMQWIESTIHVHKIDTGLQYALLCSAESFREEAYKS
jgi:hypothetical protein